MLYNLSVCSELELPVLKSEAKPDVTIRQTSGIPLPQEAHKVPFYYQVGKKQALFHYRNIATYVVNSGCEILVSPEPESSAEAVILGLLNAPFGLLFLQRGLLVLHSSALKIHKKTVAFSGASRTGKSSAALTLLTSGHKLITDDILPISVSRSTAVPTPAYPLMKISQEIAEITGTPFNSRPDGSSILRKQIHHLSPDQFEPNPPPLNCLYLLEWGQKFSIKRISPAQAIIELVAHSYGFVPRTEHQKDEKRRFLQSSQLVKTVPVFQLTRPRDIEQAMKLPHLVESHLETL